MNVEEQSLSPLPRRCGDHPRPNRFGYVAYYVEVPRGYHEDRAVRVALQIKTLRGRLQLGHVRNRLLERAGVNGSPWKRSVGQREAPPWLRQRLT
jgi:hypothetical protein